jgi:hypothetical protein
MHSIMVLCGCVYRQLSRHRQAAREAGVNRGARLALDFDRSKMGKRRSRVTVEEEAEWPAPSGLARPGRAALHNNGGSSPRWKSHSDAPYYISLVILHTQYAGARQNDFNVYACLGGSCSASELYAWADALAAAPAAVGGYYGEAPRAAAAAPAAAVVLQLLLLRCMLLLLLRCYAHSYSPGITA